jgi:hypothetical protein
MVGQAKGATTQRRGARVVAARARRGGVADQVGRDGGVRGVDGAQRRRMAWLWFMVMVKRWLAAAQRLVVVRVHGDLDRLLIARQRGRVAVPAVAGLGDESAVRALEVGPLDSPQRALLER